MAARRYELGDAQWERIKDMETGKAIGIDPYDHLLYALSLLPYWGKSPA